MTPKQKSSKVSIMCCFVVGIVVMSIICFKRPNMLDIGYLLVIAVYFVRYIYINKKEDINKN